MIALCRMKFTRSATPTTTPTPTYVMRWDRKPFDANAATRPTEQTRLISMQVSTAIFRRIGARSLNQANMSRFPHSWTTPP